MSLNNKYDEKSIQILEGLDAVRKRPGMYIGSTDTRGLHQLVWEIIDNAIDEALAGFADEIKVTIKDDNSIEVIDNGRGMPYKTHETGVPTTEVIFTILHAGGKFSEGNYKVSGGLHGVGSAVVNALSQFLEVTVYKDGGIHQQKFFDGGTQIQKMQNLGETRKTGTQVWFKPDAKIFSTTLFQYDVIKERMRESAFLIKGLKMILVDERNKQKDEFQYHDGIKAFVKFLAKDKKGLHEIAEIESEFKVEGSKAGVIEVDTAFQFTTAYQENIVSFVNNVRTRDGGTHEMGYRIAMTKTVNEYARKYAFLREKETNLEGGDIREGLTAVISVRIPEHLLEFEGQTKGKLGTPEARNALDQIISTHFQTYLEENRDTAESIVNRALQAKRVREAARKARDAARNNRGRRQKEVSLSGKLTPAQSKNKDINELFLVEGDSAGGSAKQGRNRRFQAILPLRGKVINAERTSVEELLKNEEINTIIHTIGAEFGSEFDLKKAEYDKVIIMTDADTDGAHIQVLLLTFFYRYMRPLVEAGKLYLALPPLYKLSRKRGKSEEVLYAWTDEELRSHLSSANYTIQRYKGLGEMNASQLWDTTMNPETRTLIQVTLEDFGAADRRISTLMGSNVAPRREWIDTNIDFDTTDDFLETVGDKRE